LTVLFTTKSGFVLSQRTENLYNFRPTVIYWSDFMNIVEFHQKIEQIWDEIEEQLEAQDWDVGGGSHNGGFHFAYKNERWVSNDGLDFWQALTEALAKHGEQVQLG